MWECEDVKIVFKHFWTMLYMGFTVAFMLKEVFSLRLFLAGSFKLPAKNST